MGIAVIVLAVVSALAIAAAVLATRAATRARTRLTELQSTDVLTALPNRISFEASLERLLQSGAGPTRLSVLLLELQRFNAINDTYGREVGDALMVEVAGHLDDARQRGEVLARIGGAQFALACPEVSTLAVARARAETLQKVIRAPFRIGRDTLRIDANVGVVLTDGTAPAGQVLLDAGVALQEAEERGTNSIVTFEVALRSRLGGGTQEAKLREALDKRQFWLLYMPVVAVADNRIVGVEALLRWADPDRGLMGTAEFLEVLEQSGLIVPVGGWVVDEACRQSRAWLDAFPGLDLTTTVNVSPRQLADEHFVEGILEPALSAHRLPPDKLCLEISESSAALDAAAWPALRMAKEAGVQLALDDFGVGFASLTTIRTAQLDVLKIDPAFVQAVADSREGLAIVQHIVGMAHTLGLTPVAEGVDHPDQAEALRGMGCDLAQGYYYGRPQPVDVIERLLKRGRVAPGDEGRPAIDWTGGPGATTGATSPTPPPLRRTF